MQTQPSPSAMVDAHHHLWRFGDDARYPWLQEKYDPQAFFLGSYAALREDFGPDAYLARWGNVRLAATVHVEAERHRGVPRGDRLAAPDPCGAWISQRDRGACGFQECRSGAALAGTG